jgi:predicted DNA-binding transcriptional regulator AlpA
MGAQLAADLAKRHGDSGAFLPANAVWSRYGVTAMTLHRWIADPDLGFPKPFYLGRFRFWRIAELEAWEANRPRASSKRAA